MKCCRLEDCTCNIEIIACLYIITLLFLGLVMFLWILIMMLEEQNKVVHALGLFNTLDLMGEEMLWNEWENQHNCCLQHIKETVSFPRIMQLPKGYLHCSCVNLEIHTAA